MLAGARSVSDGLIFIGVDPGAKGAAAALDLPGQDLIVFDAMGGWADAHRWLEKVKVYAGDRGIRVLIEDTPQFWKGGKSSGAAITKLAASRGAWAALCDVAGLSYAGVHPSTWQAAFGLLRTEKDANRKAALELFPWAASTFAYRKDDGRADAALIALWGARHVALL